jgi:hypothetical protein
MYTSLGGPQQSDSLVLKKEFAKIRAQVNQWTRKEQLFRNRIGHKGNQQKHHRSQIGFEA